MKRTYTIKFNYAGKQLVAEGMVFDSLEKAIKAACVALEVDEKYLTSIVITD